MQFASGRTPIMFATDVAARGLDIKGVAHVINFDMPQGDDGVENYVHRIGRTARAGATGESLTLWVEKVDKKTAKQLKKLLEDANQEVPEFIARNAYGGGGGRGWGGGSRWWGGGKGKGGKGKGGGSKGKGKGKGSRW